MLTIITAASRTHVASAKQLLYSACHFGYSVIFYDLGIPFNAIKELTSIYNGKNIELFQIRSYQPREGADFDPIERNAGNYSWKSACISDAIANPIEKKSRYIIWMDAGNIITRPLSELVAQIEAYKIYSPSSSGTIADWTHPSTAKLLDVNSELSKLPNRNGALIGIDTHDEDAARFTDVWTKLCALPDVLSPTGSSRSNHRQDQTIFSILWYKFIISRGLKEFTTEPYNNYYGVLIHQDLEIPTSKDLYSRSVDFIRQDYRTGRYFENLFSTPTPHPLRTPPILHTICSHSNTPKVTYVTPIFNSTAVLKKTLPTWINHSANPFDLIVINDASSEEESDDLENFLFAICRDYKLRDVLLIKNQTPIYETACDNLGFYLARTEYIVEMQADIFVSQFGFDQQLINALDSPTKPSAVSGRSGHPLKWIYSSERHSGDRAFGLYDDRIEDFSGALVKPLLDLGQNLEVETVNRGPLAFRKIDLKNYGYFDERHFFLGNDEHELLLRMRLREGRYPMYSPMQIHSSLTDGATRRHRSGVNKTIYDLLSHRPRSQLFEVVGRELSGHGR